MILSKFIKFKKMLSAVAIILLSSIIVSCSLDPDDDNIKPVKVNFPDPNFEVLIREVLEMPDGKITNQDLWTISSIDGSNREISDISGIEYCSGLRELKMEENHIVNIQPLTGLVLLDYINLQNNQISNIKPLVDNPGLGIGDDIIIIFENPLSDESILQYKPQLQSRGITFYSNATLEAPGEIKFIDPNFEEVIREQLNISSGAIINTDLESITKINGRNRNIANIYGIEFCTNLDTLDLGNNQISDLIPLFYLKNMLSLELDDNHIEDIRSLRYLYYLTELRISNNNI
ncbi:MAG: hypothetical protein V3R52_03350, partial [Candidatus Neomarinimicrobiota bacterium]